LPLVLDGPHCREHNNLLLHSIKQKREQSPDETLQEPLPSFYVSAKRENKERITGNERNAGRMEQKGENRRRMRKFKRHR